ncbi:MAG: hypothetical protein HN745_05585 [Deltaproteobacteria bacterium]|nr:hypothetical protein [Deltaproteobacteria bacterium]
MAILDLFSIKNRSSPLENHFKIGFSVSLLLHISLFTWMFLYAYSEDGKLQILAELESKSLNVDLLDSQQIRQLLLPPGELEKTAKLAVGTEDLLVSIQTKEALRRAQEVTAEKKPTGFEPQTQPAETEPEEEIVEEEPEPEEEIVEEEPEPEEETVEEEPEPEEEIVEEEPEPEEETVEEEPEPEEEIVEEEPKIEELEEIVEKKLDIFKEEQEIVKEVPEVLEEAKDIAEEVSEKEVTIDAVAVKVPEKDEVLELEKVEDIIETKPKPTKKEEQRIRQRVKKTAHILVKAWSFNLIKRGSEADKKTEKSTVDTKSWEGYSKIQSVISNNKALLAGTMLRGKWKSSPMSEAMLRKYLPLVNDTIKLHWHIPLELDPSLQVLMKVKIARNGRILFYEPVETSGNFLYDQSIKRVFANLVQLPPLPENFPGEFTEIGLRFKSSQTNLN